MPFFAIHAAALHPDTAPSLSIFVIAGSIGMVVGRIVWPPVRKNSIRLVMNASAFLARVAAIGALMFQLLPALRMPLTHASVFALLAFAVQGVVVSRTVYVVDAASDAERPYCISLSNLAAGIVGLVLALILGSIAQQRGAIAALLAMAPLNIVAAIYARTLPDIRRPDMAEGDRAAADGSSGAKGST